jgi:hypothetical protein
LPFENRKATFDFTSLCRQTNKMSIFISLPVWENIIPQVVLNMLSNFTQYIELFVKMFERFWNYKDNLLKIERLPLLLQNDSEPTFTEYPS